MTSGFLDRYLDPADSLLEVLFGLIMALGVTAGATLLPEASRPDARTMAAAMVGCNLAWGIIDAVFYLLGTIFNRNIRMNFARQLQALQDPARAYEMVRAEFGLGDVPDLAQEDRTVFEKALLRIFRHVPARKARFRASDFIAAGIIMTLVTMTALPGVVPLLLLDDPHTALRVGNTVQVILLFAVGYGWSRYSGANPWRDGAIIALLGSVLVLVSVALGG